MFVVRDGSMRTNRISTKSGTASGQTSIGTVRRRSSELVLPPMGNRKTRGITFEDRSPEELESILRDENSKP
jgi:hypothetical protein